MSVLDSKQPVPMRPTRRRSGRDAAARPTVAAAGARHLASDALSAAEPGPGRVDVDAARTRACRPLRGAAASRRAIVVARRQARPGGPPTEASLSCWCRGPMLRSSALAVVVPTALRVTGDNYQPVGTSQLAVPTGPPVLSTINSLGDHVGEGLPSSSHSGQRNPTTLRDRCMCSRSRRKAFSGADRFSSLLAQQAMAHHPTTQRTPGSTAGQPAVGDGPTEHGQQQRAADRQPRLPRTRPWGGRLPVADEASSPAIVGEQQQ